VRPLPRLAQPRTSGAAVGPRGRASQTHSRRTGQRTLYRLAALDPQALRAVEVNLAARLRAEIDELDDDVYQWRAIAWGFDRSSSVMNPRAAQELQDTMVKLADAMLDREGKRAAWDREPLGAVQDYDEVLAA
jgi:hypothetical protein